MENTVNSDYTLMQYCKELSLPIFVRFKPGDFDPELINFLIGMKFDVITKDNVKKVETQYAQDGRSRTLKLTPCGISVSRQLEMAIESDNYGPEAIFAKTGHKVYRYRRIGLMVYSMGAKEWELGCFSNFGSKETAEDCKTILTRFLSWVLAPMGMIGFWGMAVEKGLIIGKRKEFESESVFIDIRNERIISRDKIIPLSLHRKIMREDSSARMNERKMSIEEYIAFLSGHTTWLDTQGLSVPVRQMISQLSKITFGHIVSKNTKNSEPDLSP